MKKKCLMLLFITILIFNLSSCCFHGFQVSFISYNTDTGKYTTKQDIKVNRGNLFGEIYKPTLNSFDKDGWTYTFEHWSDTVPTDESNIDEIRDAFDDNTEIKKNITLYAVYSKVENKYTITFKTFDTTEKGYKEFQTTDEITYDTKFSDISQPSTIPQIDDYLGKKYTFSHWTTETPTASDIKTSGADFGNETQITADITLYAIYTSEDVKYTVTFKSFSTTTPVGYNNSVDATDVSYGTLLKNVSGFPTIPQIDDYLGKKYTFRYWTTETPTASDVKTTGDDFGNETPITADITLYAVYTSEDVLYTVIFKYFNGSAYENKSEKDDVSYNKKFSEIDKPTTLDDIVIGGTKYSFFGWADVETSATIIEEFQKNKVDDNSPTTSDKTFCAIYQGDYLCFTAKANTTISFDIIGTLDNPISLQYRIDSDTEFKDYTWGTSTSETSGEGLKITLNTDENIYFKGNNATFSKNDSNYVRFYNTRSIEASGSIMSLLNNRDITSNYCFTYLFRQCSYLLIAPELPATTLADYCYYNMFYSSQRLKQAPELPATTLAKGCYNSMFYGCSALTDAPDLLAETLAESCYESMFRDCKALTIAPKILATTVASKSCMYMFYGCSALTDAPELLSLSLEYSCYNSMFRDCKALTIAPKILATTVASRSCMYMFYGCSALTDAPELLSLSLEYSCYNSMFSGCTSLKTAPVLPATTLADHCYTYMFQLCSSLETPPELSVLNLEPSCYHGMFSGCTSLKTAPVLPATTLTDQCYRGMFENCTSLETAPELHATTLVSKCYFSMFLNCSSLISVTCYATNTDTFYYTNVWLQNVAPNGTFKCPSSVTWPRDDSGIPDGWTVEYI